MEDKLTVAKILKAQGIRGEVKVKTFTDSPEDLSAFGKVYIGGNPYKILHVRPVGGDGAIVALSGIADRNAAELLHGCDMLALRSDAPDLSDGVYYIADIVGCTVLTEAGERIGVVKEITPARTDIYTLECAAGGTVTFPAAAGVIVSVDTASGTVTVNGDRFDEVALKD